jgi:hypothetical protein
MNRSIRASPPGRIRPGVFATEPLDGELIVRGTTFSETAGHIGRESGEPDFTFAVFDYVSESVDVPYAFDGAAMDAYFSSLWDGMNAALDRLRERIAPNDNVFIYYSGHGGRALVRDPEERCGEALITVEGRGFMDTDMEAKLKTLSRKANKMVVFLDACHSGGVTTRAATSRFQAKYFPRSASGEACSTPVNVLKKNIGAGTRSIGSGACASSATSTITYEFAERLPSSSTPIASRTADLAPSAPIT